MSDAKDHLDPKEATEAKLCAYLEGELPPAERVEIEKHLMANPQHRQLLTDLAQTRGWMRLIPRESAPPDLADTFAAQMERSTLLNDRQDSGAAMNRLPQYLLLAAIVMLTLGLGVLIVVMLHGDKNYATGPIGMPAGGMPAGGIATGIRTATTVPAGGTDSTSIRESADETHAKAMAVAPTALPPMTGNLGGRASVSRNAPKHDTITGEAITAESPADRIDRAKIETVLHDRLIPTGRRTVCLVVSTPAPAATESQLHRFFSSNQLVFDDGKSPIFRRNDGNQLAAASANRGYVNNGGGGGGGVGGGVGRSFDPAPEPDTANQNAKNSNVQQQQQTPPQPNVQNAIVQPATPAAPAAKTDAASAAEDAVYVGRGLTPLQLELLHGTLVTGGIEQSVRRLDLSQISAPLKDAEPAAGPALPTITRGQMLTVTVPQLVGPGIEKTNLVKVADDGTIILPMLDALPAAGATQAELQDRIAAKYREGNLIPAATVTVVMNTPATQPVRPDAPQAATSPVAADAAQAIVPLAASQPAQAMKATSQPVDDGKLDVVVYIRKAK